MNDDGKVKFDGTEVVDEIVNILELSTELNT